MPPPPPPGTASPGTARSSDRGEGGVVRGGSLAGEYHLIYIYIHTNKLNCIRKKRNIRNYGRKDKNLNKPPPPPPLTGIKDPTRVVRDQKKTPKAIR